MKHDAAGEPAGRHIPAEMAQQVEATMLSVWRRMLIEGGGPELTLAEAATLLGSSVDTVRRRIKQDRSAPSTTTAAESASAPASPTLQAAPLRRTMA